MLSSSSMKSGGGGPSEPLTRLACIRQCQETVQELVSRPMEVCLWLQQLTRPSLLHQHNPHHPHQQQQAQNIAEKRARFESILNDISVQLSSLRHLFVRLREIHEYVLARDQTATSNQGELSRLLKQKAIYEEILSEKQCQLKVTIDTMRDLTYQINTMLDLRHDSSTTGMINSNSTTEK